MPDRDVPGELADADGLMELMARNTKMRHGRLTFILVRRIGEAYGERRRI